MKRIPKSKGLLVIALIVAMIAAGGMPMAGVSYAATENNVADSTALDELSKVATPTGINEWEVTLTANGNLKKKTSDIVIVMDRSRSMKENDKITKAKDAAISFAKQILAAKKDTQIAVVTFNKTATLVQGFTTDEAILVSSINSISTIYGIKDKTSGTNLQAGLHKAAQLMDSSIAGLKAVVLIGDGEPTHSYELSGIGNVNLSCEIADGTHNPEWDESDITFDYAYTDDKIMGSGTLFTITGPALTIEKTCPSDKAEVHKFTYEYPANHGIPAIYEAQQMVDEKVNIYSIGIGVVEDGRDVLKKCQNKGYYYERASSAEYDFSNIAKAINAEDFEAVVTDPIGNKFNLITNGAFDWAVEGSDSAKLADIVISKGSVSYDSTTALINWNIGNLKSGETATMSYHVQAKSGTVFDLMNNQYQTNGETTLTITYDGEKPFSSNFPIPEVPLTGGAVTIKAITVNKEGKPIDSTGTEKDFAGAYILEQSRFPEMENEFMVYGTCLVSMGAISGYTYQGFSYSDSVGNEVERGTDSFINLSLTQDNNTPTVYFKYLQVEQDPADAELYDVIVKYVGENGVSIHDSKMITSQTVGAVVTESAIEITGYTLNDSSTKSCTVAETDENTISFVYKKKSTSNSSDNSSGGGSSGGSGGGSSGGSGGSGGGSSITTVNPALNKTDHFAYVVGYPDGSVRPLGKITREEVVVIFYRLLTDESRKAYASTTQPFNDVSKNHWSNDEIATLYNAKIIQGNSDGSFEPEIPITRAEFATIAAKFDVLEDTDGNKFSDIENHWARKYINSSAKKGWINGYADGTFRPDNIIIRCEAMKLINEVLDRRVNLEGLHKDTKQWPDNTTEKWYYEIVLEATNTHDYERANKAKSTEKWTGIRENPIW